MMAKLQRYLLAFLLFGCTACEGFLDRYPVDAIPEDDSWMNKEDFDRHWVGVYATLKNSGGFCEAARLYGDVQCDLAYLTQGASSSLKEVYNWTFTSQTDAVNTLYYAMWNTIAEANRMFDRLPEMREKLSGDDSLSMEQMMGDMYMFRALCYSKLTEYYCDAYDPAAAGEQLGMPLCRSVRNIGKLGRASLRDTYDFIYEDLEQAAALLDSITISQVMNRQNFLFSKQTALALWARMALYRQDFGTAAAKAEQALQICLNGGMELDIYRPDSTGAENYYVAMFYGDEGTQIDGGRELMFFVGMDEMDVTGSFGSYFCLNPELGYYSPEFVPAQELVDSYVWENNVADDIRKGIFFGQAEGMLNGNKTFTVLYKDIHNAELDLSEKTPVFQSRPKLFRMSELYLIIAEANARLAMEGGGGSLARAKEVLEQLWRARTVTGKIATENKNMLSRAGAEELFRLVKTERKKELCFEGFRLTDLKRWGEGFRRKVQPYTVSPANELNITAGDPRFTWPIPLHELEVNPNMKPNKSN